MDTEDSYTTVGPIIEDITKLCDFCIEVAKLIGDVPGDPERRNHGLVPGRGLESCQLCEVISSAGLNHLISLLQRHHLVAAVPALGRLTIAHHLSHEANRKNRYHWSTERRERWGGIKIRHMKFRIWADIGEKLRSCYIWLRSQWNLGSPACKTLIDRPPISGSSMHQVRDLARDWLKRCRDQHAITCIPDDEMPMPTRVLALCGDYARPSIMLVRSKGMRGRYLALRVS